MRSDKTKKKNRQNNREVGDIPRVIYNGNYYFTSKEPIYIKFLWVLDWLFFGTVVFLLGVVVGFGIDKIPRKLDRTQSKALVGVEAVGELLLILGGLFLIILLFINRIPGIAPRIPAEHTYWKNYSGGILVTLGLFLSNPTFADKVQFVLNTRASDEEERLAKVSECIAARAWPHCIGFIP